MVLGTAQSGAGERSGGSTNALRCQSCRSLTSELPDGANGALSSATFGGNAVSSFSPISPAGPGSAERPGSIAAEALALTRASRARAHVRDDRQTSGSRTFPNLSAAIDIDVESLGREGAKLSMSGR